MDQYHHPVEKQYSIDQIFKWFKANDVEIASYFPDNFEYSTKNSMKLFEKKNKDNSTFLRDLIQLIAIFSSLGSERFIFCFR